VSTAARFQVDRGSHTGKLDYSASALLTVDVQRDFYEPGAVAEVAGTYERLPQMQRAVAAFRAAKLPIIHLVRLYLPDGSNAEPVRRPLLESGQRIVAPHSLGSQLAPGLLPDSSVELSPELLLQGGLQALGAHEWALYKPRWGGFYQTQLGEHLQRLGVSTVIVAGCNWPNCPRTTLYEASERDFSVALVEDALSGLYDRAVEEARSIGTTILAAADLELMPVADLGDSAAGSR
jgi:nicotinamidase-related amidase